MRVHYALAACTNVANCGKARADETIEWYRGAGEYCPECGEALVLRDPSFAEPAAPEPSVDGSAAPSPPSVSISAATPVEIRVPPFPERRGSGNPPLVHLFAEGIACDLYVRSFNGREKNTTYELVISNKTVVDISCRLYGIDALGHTREFGMLAVGKQSAGNSFFSLPFETGDQRRLFVEVVGDGVSLFAEALQPKAQASLPWPRSAFVLALLTSAITVGATYFIEKPAIEGFSVPSSTAPGRVNVLYVIGGFASARYSAITSEGLLLASGKVSAPSGEITIHVPPEMVGHIVHVSLDASGPLGRTMRAADFRVVSEFPKKR